MPSPAQERPAAFRTDRLDRPSRATSDATRDGGVSKPLLIGFSAAAAVVALAVVFLLGRLAGDKPSEVVAHTAPNPNVLDVGGRDVPTVVGRPDAGQTLASPAIATTTVPRVDANAVTIPTPAGKGAQRTLGLNYVLIESYAPNEQDRAEATRQSLVRNGMDATIERDIPGWGKRLCVIGTVGFERIRGNDQLRTYLEDLNRISEVESKSRQVKTFDPQPIQWTKK